MSDKYQVVEILNDNDGEKVTWESQEYNDYRTAHRIKAVKGKHNTNPDVSYEIKQSQEQNVHNSHVGLMR